MNTVHYYRRKDIVDPPEGRTAAARYGLRHLWQVAGARLAGHLGLVTLAEARRAMREPTRCVLGSSPRGWRMRARARRMRSADGVWRDRRSRQCPTANLD